MSDTQVANGWTAAEAKAMDRHISAKMARESARTEPSEAATRQAERAADATAPMHDAGREAQADARGRQAERQARGAAFWAGIAAAAPEQPQPAQSEVLTESGSQRQRQGVALEV